jgi:ketohexokinase/beta-glucosidase
MASRYRDPFHTPEPEAQHIPVPKQNRSEETTRDQKLQIHTLYYQAGWKVDDILLLFSSLTRKQIYFALESRPTPQKARHCGRHVKLSTPQRKRLVKWATTDSHTRDIPWAEIPKYLPDTLEWRGVGSKAIRRAFQTENYTRGVRRRKPPLSETNRLIRLAWAEEHVNWSEEQWDTILWSDETWTTSGPHRRQWCTRKIGTSELFHPDCIQHRWQRKIGWMFWGCISGKYGKGPGLFWEKEWKTITKETYCEHTLPVFWKYLWNHPGLQFQQDGGPGHTAKYSIAYMLERGIHPIFWPAFSPDLSPIETLWNRMKDILSLLDPEIHRSYVKLRAAVQEAWNDLTDAEIRDSIHTMHDRCVAVILAHGMYIDY